MRIFLRYLLVLLGLIAIPRPGEAGEPIQKGDILVVPLKGDVSPSLLLFLRRAVKAAETAQAGAAVFEMDTYGGRLDTAAEIIAVLNHATIPTYTFINSNAGSAGSLIALATQHIYMSPVSAIGAAAPVLSTGEDLPGTERDKTISYWSALTRSSATRNGHNPDLGEAFMSKKKEVKIGERVIHPKGTLLTLSAQEAIEKIDGKPLLAVDIAASVEDLAKKAGLKGRLVPFEPSGFEQLAFWITKLAPLLLLLGIVCAYIEFKIPGASLPGIIAVCFALFFLGHYLAGLAGWEAPALFVIGLVLVLIEILFFAHSTIIFGVAGALLILASILWAMVDRYPGENFVPSGQMMAIPLRNLSLAVLAATLAIIILARYLPRTSLYRRFALMTTNPPGTSLSGGPQEFAATALALTPGMKGTALTSLRPSGKARFADHTVDVVTEGEFITAETAVTVIQADGMRVVVKPV